MSRSYRFAIIRFAPDEIRGETINIGAVVFRDHGLDIRTTRKLDRMHAISAALDTNSVAAILDNLRTIDDQSRRSGLVVAEDRAKSLLRVGPLTVSQLGTLIADSDAAYEDRIEGLMRLLVEPEPAPARPKQKRTHLFSLIKATFKKQRVLAQKDEDLDSHRIVSAYHLDDGLVADLVLRNGLFHVVETVDASGDETKLRKAITDIAMSALVLERARMKFGEEETKARLVYQASGLLERAARPSLDAAEHQGAQLINWASIQDRDAFVRSLSALATPVNDHKRKDFVAPGHGDLFH